MPSFRVLLLHHGYLFLFCYLLAVQAGLPLPADPLLMIMGALVGDGHYSYPGALLSATVPALLGDLLWYEVGRRRGRPILSLLCKLSLEPDTCVRKTESEFASHGAWTLLFAKFVPGISLVSMPLAGAIRMPRSKFLVADAAGCTLWSAAYLLAGVVFHRQVDRLLVLLGLYGRRAGLIIFLLLTGFLVARYLRRVYLLRQFRIHRIGPSEAFALLSGEDPPLVVDLRSPMDREQSGLKIINARLLKPEELRSRSHEIPEDQKIILYCT